MVRIIETVIYYVRAKQSLKIVIIQTIFNYCRTGLRLKSRLLLLLSSYIYPLTIFINLKYIKKIKFEIL